MRGPNRLKSPASSSALKSHVKRLLPLRFMKEIRRDKRALFSLAIISAVVFCAIFADLFASNYATQNLSQRFLPPSLNHPFGTDLAGRDLLSRIVYGTRLALYIIILSTILALPTGIFLGGLPGYIGGKADLVAGRIVDVLLSFPPILLAIALIAILGSGLNNAIFAFAIVQTAAYARLTRGQVLATKEKTFVEASKMLGQSRSRIFLTHILPNSWAPVIIASASDAPTTLIRIAGLSYLGLGSQPPSPDWGTIIYENQAYIRNAAYAVIFPGLAILIVAVAFCFLGEFLKDYLGKRPGRMQ